VSTPDTLRIYLDTGAVLEFVVTDWKARRHPLTGKLTELHWTLADGAGPRPAYMDLERIVAVIAVPREEGRDGNTE
jgi:hypothetical protein